MGRKLGLTLDDVTDAAVAEAEEVGLDAVGLSSVAARLGIKTPSMYNHVDGVDGLRRLVGCGPPRPWPPASKTQPPRRPGGRRRRPATQIRALAAAYRTFAHDHPQLYAAMLPAPDPEVDPDGAAVFAQSVEVVARVFADTGVAEADMIPTIRAFRSTIHGFVDLELRGGFGLPEDADHSFDTAVDIVIAALDA